MRNRIYRNLAGALAVFASCFLSGCCILPIPLNRYETSSRTNVDSDDLLWLIPGQTTRQEVALRLGEPDEATADDCSLSYRWEKTRLGLIVVVVLGMAGGIGGFLEYGRHYSLDLHFDAWGKLERCEINQSKLAYKRTL